MPSPRTLQQFGILVLVVGLIGAGAVYWFAQRQETAALQKASQVQSDSSDAGLSPDDSKRYARDTELNMGKGVMVIDRFLHSAGQLFQGTNLAFVIAALSIITAIGCFAMADRFSLP